MPRCGRHPGSEARAMLHVQGRYRSHVPATQPSRRKKYDFTRDEDLMLNCKHELILNAN